MKIRKARRAANATTLFRFGMFLLEGLEGRGGGLALCRFFALAFSTAQFSASVSDDAFE